MEVWYVYVVIVNNLINTHRIAGDMWRHDPNVFTRERAIASNDTSIRSKNPFVIHVSLLISLSIIKCKSLLLTCVRISSSSGLHWFIYFTRSSLFWCLGDFIFWCFRDVIITTWGSSSFLFRFSIHAIENVVLPVTVVHLGIKVQTGRTMLPVDSFIYGAHVNTSQVLTAALGILVMTVVLAWTLHIYNAWNKFLMSLLMI